MEITVHKRYHLIRRLPMEVITVRRRYRRIRYMGACIVIETIIEFYLTRGRCYRLIYLYQMW